MYKVTVPINLGMLEVEGPEAYFADVARFGAERVFFCCTASLGNSEADKKTFEAIRKNAAVFHAHGYEVGCWFCPLKHPGDPHYQYMVSPNGGKVSRSEVCPTDEDFRRDMGRFVAGAAATGVDLIMLDDDFRFGFQTMGVGCVCPNHIRMMEEKLGETILPERLGTLLLAGGPNKYKDAWIRGNGESLEQFAKEMRAFVDSVDPAVRMGFCACITNWDIDGTTPDRISRILAGSTKPFYRLIGAPYWAALKNWGNRLGDVIDLERMEKSWNTDEQIEIFSEGDTDPRPRFRTPAAYLECFDTALRADGTLDGILKYGLEYVMKPGVETGYRVFHEKNRDLYEMLPVLFDGKEHCGLRVYEYPSKYALMQIPPEKEGKDEIQEEFFSFASRTLTAHGIPHTYLGTDSAGIVFGANAELIPSEACANGLILDAEAAQILKRRGIDTGLEGLETCRHSYAELWPGCECLMLNASVDKATVSGKAEIESRFRLDSGEIVPGSYRYENERGQRFLVWCFHGTFCKEDLFRQYQRADQIVRAAQWMGHPLPAVCTGHPDLYMIAKKAKDFSSLSVGLWNFSIDKIYDPEVLVRGADKLIRTVRCTAKTRGEAVLLSDIEPFAFAGFEIALKRD